ncbi:protein STRUBBELIG-RECEPTOR FAMILY 3-like isoform X2 [Carya illinoinensis]|uniref:Protein kinase domain-containing protein n=1 Tax=Carya illinoinensis TaxID=32201 RepID=A0A8T1QVC6_CARIL|nr:protein STRUBBELIG-RECEPTOR FAMILY 3-like isoform X2 [Carya illinoinensis]KAG6657922.1 hypothetical protein CIPAW_04G123600 [Carya illinoinensis]
MRLSMASVGGKRSAMKSKDLKISALVLVWFLWIWEAPVSRGETNPSDVAAINNLYVAMGSPLLPGWVATGGDPCGEAWQGVVCTNTDIMGIVLNGANLGGELGGNLRLFASIKAIDLSNNHIGGSIPTTLPSTMQNFFLSANQFSGSIPSSLSSLTQLSAMSLNDNHLSGEIPDAFQSLTGLINLDLSSNNLSGELPPSLETLSSLTTLRLQSNQLSGTLDVLQDLPLRDLNIENNQFSGPIPEKLLSIPNFRKDGNPFNTTAPPVTPPTSPLKPPPVGPAPPFFKGLSPERTPAKQANGPSATGGLNSEKTKKVWTTKRVVGISIAAVFFLVILALGLALLIPWFSRRREEDRFSRLPQIGAYEFDRQNLRDNGSLSPPNNEKVQKGAVVRPKDDHQAETRRVEAIAKSEDEKERNVQRWGTLPKEDHAIDMRPNDMQLMHLTPPPPPSPPPPPPPPVEKVIAAPKLPAEVTRMKLPSKTLYPPTRAKSFTIASLQQYTNSFSQENFIGEGMLGTVYRAQLPDGKLLAVKKLDKKASSQKDDDFLELVNNIDRIQHANVVELIGYCVEHGQRLLIYEYCSNGTLHDTLHSDDELKKKLSWNARIRMALGAARGLEYLHEVCQPPVIHRNFRSGNVLLDDDLSVHVSDCGLAPLIASGSVSQLSGSLLTTYGYGAPEFESGIYTEQSDIYSFGVVMLELLTGRISYDRSRTRGEQFLVRWAIPQLHDIDALSRMVDPALNGEYPAKSVSNFADIIARCVRSQPEFRPPMSEVVQDLLNMIRKESNGSGSNGD